MLSRQPVRESAAAVSLPCSAPQSRTRPSPSGAGAPPPPSSPARGREAARATAAGAARSPPGSRPPREPWGCRRCRPGSRRGAQVRAFPPGDAQTPRSPSRRPVPVPVPGLGGRLLPAVRAGEDRGGRPGRTACLRASGGPAEPGPAALPRHRAGAGLLGSAPSSPSPVPGEAPAAAGGRPHAALDLTVRRARRTPPSPPSAALPRRSEGAALTLPLARRGRSAGGARRARPRGGPGPAAFVPLGGGGGGGAPTCSGGTAPAQPRSGGERLRVCVCVGEQPVGRGPGRRDPGLAL